jgi:hypothetical protein
MFSSASRRPLKIRGVKLGGGLSGLARPQPPEQHLVCVAVFRPKQPGILFLESTSQRTGLPLAIGWAGPVPRFPPRQSGEHQERSWRLRWIPSATCNNEIVEGMERCTMMVEMDRETGRFFYWNLRGILRIGFQLTEDGSPLPVKFGFGSE